MMNIMTYKKQYTEDFEFETIIKEDGKQIKSITIETTYEDTYVKTYTVTPISHPVYPYLSIAYMKPIFPLKYTDITEEEPEVIFYRSLENMIQAVNTYLQEEYHKDDVTTFGVKIEYDRVSYGYFPVCKDGNILLRKMGVVI